MKKNTDTYTLIKFIFHQTTPEEEKEVLVWLEQDKSRYSILEKIARSKSAIAQNRDDDWVKKDFSQLQSRIANKQMRRRFLRIAAVFVGLIVTSFSAYLLVNEDTQWQTVTVAKGEHNEVVLPDGTKVKLAPDTKFHYPVDFSASTREVKLEGQAFFDVAHDKDRPFIVHTTFSDVEVLGTKFNVKAYPNEKNTTTLLVEGKVNVGFMNADRERIGEQLLAPAQMSNYNHKTQKINVHRVDMKHELAWLDKRLSFRNESFSEIANKIERHYNVNVIFYDGRLSAKRITGEFKEETITEVLEIFQEWTSFKYIIEDNTVKIRE